MKRNLLVSMILVLSVLLSPAANAAATTFTDVPSDSWYAEPVAWAVAQGITTGTSSTTFSPEDICTNAQVITFIWRACGAPDSSGFNPFNDISAGTFYYKAALWAYECGIVDANSFYPDRLCTRSMAATYLWKMADSPAAATISYFTDVNSFNDFAEAVAWAIETGITNGTSSSTFSPDNTCTRAEIITFLYRDPFCNSSEGSAGESEPEISIIEIIT